MSRLNKALSVYLFLICLITVSAVSTGAQRPAEGAVKLFNGRDGSGASQDIPPGTYLVNGSQLGGSSGKDAGFSVQVPKGAMVRFCDDRGSAGEGGENCEDYGEGTHNLKSTKFNFIKVWTQVVTADRPPVKPAVIVFEQANWGGRSQIFMPGMYRSIRGEFGKIGDNVAMSIIVAKGFHVRLCSDEGVNFRGSGDCEEHDDGRHNLRFADSISFIEVKDLSDMSPDDDKMPVILYEDGSQGGKMQGFDVGVFVASLNQLGKVGNDQASSITVKSGYRVIVCADEGPVGGSPDKCEEFAAGKHNLRNKDSASYLKVWKGDK